MSAERLRGLDGKVSRVTQKVFAKVLSFAERGVEETPFVLSLVKSEAS